MPKNLKVTQNDRDMQRMDRCLHQAETDPKVQAKIAKQIKKAFANGLRRRRQRKK